MKWQYGSRIEIRLSSVDFGDCTHVNSLKSHPCWCILKVLLFILGITLPGGLIIVVNKVTKIDACARVVFTEYCFDRVVILSSQPELILYRTWDFINLIYWWKEVIDQFYNCFISVCSVSHVHENLNWIIFRFNTFDWSRIVTFSNWHYLVKIKLQNYVSERRLESTQ